jgi:hypothetical protein
VPKLARDDGIEDGIVSRPDLAAAIVRDLESC